MTTLLTKLNLRENQNIVVVNAPKSFAPALKAIPRDRLHQRISAIKDATFVLVFVERKSELDNVAPVLVAKTTGDAVLWFAYPKRTSKMSTCDFNRDTGWDVLRGT